MNFNNLELNSINPEITSTYDKIEEISANSLIYVKVLNVQRRCEVELKFTVHYSLFGPNSEL